MEILHIVESLGILKAPHKMTSSPEWQSQTKYCQFYRDNWHDTEQCIELLKEIEQAIWQGYLKEFVNRFVDKRQDIKRWLGCRTTKLTELHSDKTTPPKVIHMLHSAPAKMELRNY